MQRALKTKWPVALVLMAAACSPVEKLWNFQIGSPSYSTPLILGDYIIFGSESGTLYAADKRGQARWQYQVPSGEIFSRPASDGKLIFFGSTNQQFYALDGSGQLRWTFITRERIKSDPLVAGDTVYLTSYDGRLYALRTEDGKKLWQFPAEPPKPGEGQEAVPAEQITTGSFSYSAPFLADGVIYVGNLDGYLYAVAAGSGQLKWRFKTDGGVTSSPLVENGLVYFGSKDDHVYAIKTDGSGPAWKFKTEGDVLSSPRISEGVLYIGSNDKHLYALKADSGELVCKFAAAGPVVSIPVVYKNLVIFNGGRDDGRVYMLNKQNCQLFYSFRTDYKIESDPVLEENRLYVTSGDRNLYAFEIKKTP
jgi:outer membrane protein assembly factor BamB